MTSIKKIGVEEKRGEREINTTVKAKKLGISSQQQAGPQFEPATLGNTLSTKTQNWKSK